MKRILIAVLVLAGGVLFVFGCSSEKVIENKIDDWTDAINDGDTGALTDAVSPDSEMYDPVNIDNLIDVYFSGLTPVGYDLGNIDIDKPYADVPAEATYAGIPNDAKFVMKKESGFFSFLFPKWNVYQYYDNGDFGTPVWKKVRR